MLNVNGWNVMIVGFVVIGNFVFFGGNINGSIGIGVIVGVD